MTEQNDESYWWCDKCKTKVSVKRDIISGLYKCKDCSTIVIRAIDKEARK